MKLLNNLIEHQSKYMHNQVEHQSKYTHNQVLEWLYWLREHCTHSTCICCTYLKVKVDHPVCEVLDICKEVSTTKVLSPNLWSLIRKGVSPTKPENLEFLRHLYWSKRGNPVPPPKGGNRSEITRKADRSR